MAEHLFREGRQLMEEGKLKQACPKLEESQRLDPGTGTLWHLARCYELTGRMASAWGKYHEVAQEARRRREADKVSAALEAARKVEPKVARLIIVVPKAHRVAGLTVTRNGVDVGPGAWETPIPVDPGVQILRAHAVNRRPWQRKVKIAGNGTRLRVSVPELEEVSILGPPRPATDPGPWYGDWTGWALTGTGGAILAGGTASLLYSIKLENDANDPLDLADKDRLLDRAQNLRWAGIAMTAVGTSALLAGIVKLALHPGRESERERGVRAHFSVRGGGLVLGIRSAF